MYSSVVLHSLCCAIITSITFLSPQTETLYQPLNSPFSHLQPLVTSNHLHVYEAKVKVTQPCLTVCNPMDYIFDGILQARRLEWVPFPLLQEIFPTQGSNPGLPHCRQILYQLSYEGSLCI